MAGHNARMVAELSEADSVEGCIQRTSRMLTDMTRNVGIAAALPGTEQELEHIELVALVRPARADGAGDARPHGAQPRGDAR